MNTLRRSTVAAVVSKQSGLLAFVCCLALPVSPACASLHSSAVLTFHNDNSRTGQNTNEFILTPARVSSSHFVRLFTRSVDGYVYAQPLIMTNVLIPGKGVHNVLFVATEHDSVYAFDADNDIGANASPLWKTSFIDPANGITTVPAADTSSSSIVPEVGITSTPVIDPVTGTIYVEARTKEIVGSTVEYHHRLHALDITTGEEKFGGPVDIQATVAGTGDGSSGGVLDFNPLREMNRPGLLLNHGVIYIAFGSLGDKPPYHGWLLGYDAQTLAQTGVFNANPNGADAGIWESGCGPCADADGNIYVSTGNGTYDNITNNDYGDSLLKLSTTNGLVLADYFTPHNQSLLEAIDKDFGSGGVVLLPDEVGSAAHPHLLVCADKLGTIYLVDRDNLTQYHPSGDLVVQELVSNIFKCWSTPVYFNHTVYFTGVGDYLKAFSLNNAVLGETVSTNTATRYNTYGTTPSLSANGTNNAILWTISTNGNGQSVLHALNASDITNDLYNSAVAGQNPGTFVKFITPTIANGKVYVGTANSVAVYGLNSPVITEQPQALSLGVGSNATFSVTATSLATATYQWRKDGFDIANATNATFTVTNVQLADVATYSVVVSDSIGLALSVGAPLTLTNTMVTITSLGGGTNQISFVGQPDQPYRLQWATNLTTSPWFDLGTNTPGINGLGHVLDTSATNLMRFYRVQLVQ